MMITLGNHDIEAKFSPNLGQELALTTRTRRSVTNGGITWQAAEMKGPQTLGLFSRMMSHWEVKLDPWEGKQQGAWGIIFTVICRVSPPVCTCSHDGIPIGGWIDTEKGSSSFWKWMRGAPVPGFLGSRNQFWSFGRSHETHFHPTGQVRKQGCRNTEDLA